MKALRKLILILFFSIFWFTQSFSQLKLKEYPVIGEPIPDFTLTNVLYFETPTVTKTSLKGKPVILDFFSVGCSACFASFPKTNELKNEFKDRVNIILVGREHEKVRYVFDEFRKRANLDLPVTYAAELLDKWKIEGFPRVVWIDAEGVVRAVTDTRQVDAENIRALIAGKPFTFKTDYSYNERAPSLNVFEEPLLIGGNGGSETDFSFRSIIYPFNPATEQVVPTSIKDFNDPEKRKGLNASFYGFQCTGADIWYLYVLAYLGRSPFYDAKGNWYNAPILELSDPSEFQYDYSTGKNIFNYSIIVPEHKNSTEYIQILMQQDLERYLGFSAKVEKRMAPYWRLTATERAKKELKTVHPGIKPSVEGTYAGRKCKNVPMKYISGALNSLGGLAAVDETGIDFNIDLEINVDMTNIDAVIQELRKNGLILEKATREMNVIVIKDAAKPLGNQH